jgi:hypothetical protein
MTSLQTNRVTWDTLSIEGIINIERVVAEFYIECPVLPSRSFRIKIRETMKGRYVGYPNVAIKSSDDTPEWSSGLGETINEALEDTLRSFMASLERVQSDRRLLKEDDLEWSACEDF